MGTLMICLRLDAGFRNDVRRDAASNVENLHNYGKLGFQPYGTAAIYLRDIAIVKHHFKRLFVNVACDVMQRTAIAWMKIRCLRVYHGEWRHEARRAPEPLERRGIRVYRGAQ
jgi:hypothetical protein